MTEDTTPAEHGYDYERSRRAPAAYIFCLCGWQHDSLFTWRNEKALRRHMDMHYWQRGAKP